MAKKTSAPKTTSRREAAPGARTRAEVRDHIIGVALGLFGLLSLIALLSSGGSVLDWWRSVMAGALGWGAVLVPLLFFVAAAVVWRRALARRLLLPGIGALPVAVALLGIVPIATRHGGAPGRAVGNGHPSTPRTPRRLGGLLAVMPIRT